MREKRQLVIGLELVAGGEPLGDVADRFGHRAILRAGAYELSHRRDVSVPSTIAAYLDVATSFHDDAEIKFINGALDAVARRLRGDEMKPKAHAR